MVTVSPWHVMVNEHHMSMDHNAPYLPVAAGPDSHINTHTSTRTMNTDDLGFTKSQGTVRAAYQVCSESFQQYSILRSSGYLFLLGLAKVPLSSVIAIGQTSAQLIVSA